jgi:uncharacterized membrane protein
MRISAIVSFAILASMSVPASAQTLSAAEVEAEIIGKTTCVETPRGEVCVRHNADGTSNVVSGMPEQKGTWRMDEDHHCVTWPGAEERCTNFERRSNGYVTGAGPITVK